MQVIDTKCAVKYFHLFYFYTRYEHPRYVWCVVIFHTLIHAFHKPQTAAIHKRSWLKTLNQRGWGDIAERFASGSSIAKRTPQSASMYRLWESAANIQSTTEKVLIYSNKSTNQMHQSPSFIACRLNTAQHVSGILMAIMSSSTAVAASGLPLERDGSSAVGRGRAAALPRPTALLPPRSEGKTRGCYSSYWAPDDGHEDARNMLSCI